MLFKLLKKEYGLSAHPMMFVFTLFTIMILIPNYPPIIGFFYVIVSFTFLFPMCFENKDYYYTALLPIRKRDVVKARMLNVFSMELLSIIIAIPCALVWFFVYPSEMKTSSLSPSFALFGSALLMYGIFNFIFFILHYKTASKLLVPMLVSMLVSAVIGTFLMVLFEIPQFGISDYLNSHIYIQIIILAVGIIGWVLLTYFAYRISAKRFEKIDL